jgi:toxin ParE1/3/4
MMLVRFTKQAKADLSDVWLAVAARDERIADRVLDTLYERCVQLSEHPELGPSRPDIAAEVRSLLSERWLILYRVLPEQVQVVRIVDGARDLSRVPLPPE